MSRCCIPLLVFVAAALQAGCLFHERDVTFHVTDEATGAAIQGVRVSVVHQASKINHPGSRSGLTDEAGQVVLRLTRGSILWHPAGRGYDFVFTNPQWE